MLFTQYIARAIAVLAIFICMFAGIKAFSKTTQVTVSSTAFCSQEPSTSSEKPVEVACGTCGCGLGPVQLMACESDQRKKDRSVLTDSLWGNLILSMAYQRDKQLQKLLKRAGLVNGLTDLAVTGIYGLSLAQGISALDTLNPSDKPDGSPGQDSYTPGILGVVASGTTLTSFAARIIANHIYSKKLLHKQRQVRERVEAVLAHLEYAGAKCADAQKELADLIGEKATNEFLQLWRSSHAVANAGSSG